MHTACIWHSTESACCYHYTVCAVKGVHKSSDHISSIACIDAQLAGVLERILLTVLSVEVPCAVLQPHCIVHRCSTCHYLPVCPFHKHLHLQLTCTCTQVTPSYSHCDSPYLPNNTHTLHTGAHSSERLPYTALRVRAHSGSAQVCSLRTPARQQ
jgi:hypothetical protein